MQPDAGDVRRHPVYKAEISVDAFRDEPNVSAGFTVALDDDRADSSGLLIFLRARYSRASPEVAGLGTDWGQPDFLTSAWATFG
ncbi:hypothetical protein DMH03_11965 [Amycolatopsis sp. WAC 01376]|nr:hypothetical protein DMH03_11965 [Amycolatopsis sp. WAC 01376]